MYICRADRHDLGVIDGYTLFDGRCAIRGKFAKYLLSRRVMYPTVTLEGNVEKLLGDIVTQKLGIAVRPISGREYFGEELSTTKTGGTLLEWALEMAETYGFSFDIEYDFSANELEFVVWNGIDRSRKQNLRNWIEFSAEWENLTDFSLIHSDREYKNVAVVAGMGKGDKRICTVVDLCPDNEDRREMWVDAKDVQKEESTTDDEYLQLLRKRGITRLNERTVSDEFTAKSEDSLFHYPDDYDLGDIVTVSDSRYSLSIDCRIIEIDETINNGIQKVNLKFSNGLISED